jgi:hypothetical protein
MKYLIAFVSAALLIGTLASAQTLGISNSYYGNSVLNWQPQNLQHWRAALARVRAGSGRARIMFMTDSQFGGAGTGTSGTLKAVGGYANGAISLFSGGKFLGANVPTSFNSLLDDQDEPAATLAAGSQVNYNSYDPRLTALGTGWTSNTGTGTQPGMCGDMFYWTGSTASDLVFTPPGNIDNFEIDYPVSSMLGTFQTHVDSGSPLTNSVTGLTTMNEAGTPAFVKALFSVTRGAHAIHITPTTSGSATYVAHIIAWDSTTPAIDVLQCSWWGSGIGNYESGFPWIPFGRISLVNPDLLVFAIGGVDVKGDPGTGANVPAFAANYQSFITQALSAGGDMLLVAGPPGSETNFTNGVVNKFTAATYGLAVTNSFPMLDFRARWVSWSQSNATLGMSDPDHPTAVAAQDEALALCQVLCSP